MRLRRAHRGAASHGAGPACPAAPSRLVQAVRRETGSLVLVHSRPRPPQGVGELPIATCVADRALEPRAAAELPQARGSASPAAGVTQLTGHPHWTHWTHLDALD